MDRSTWVESAIANADTLWARSKSNIIGNTYSDIRDQQGHQYVDLVMEGGGMLGIALVGYTYILEKAGIRFRKIAGTSAGAINALFLAAAGTPSEVKSETLLTIMSNADFASFEDGRDFSRKTVARLLSGKGSFRSFVLHPIDALRTLNHLLKFKGLNPGNTFKQWLEEQLKELGIENTAQLNTRINQFPDLVYRDSRDTQVGKAEVALVAADITTETRAVFPRKAPLYFASPDSVNPAEFVRASMSVPGFFEPHVVGKIPQLDDGEAVAENWRKIKGIKDPRAYFKNAFPEDVQFVDGGMVSNFPFDIFHSRSGTPKLPTFGVKLELDLYQPKTNKLGRFTTGLINTCRHMLDNHFRATLNAEYNELVKEIAITPLANGERPHWLNFSMPDRHCEHLFLCGAEAAIDFLRTDPDDPEQGFNWAEYLQIRQSQSIPSVEHRAVVEEPGH
ncbi:NTE family protein [Microbulbifer donghaiensis]|uniref:NTE family protein n=1 Tax=Microbulbifer donghaiensis TaxID=494016 RepID=A0A1M4VPW2_9GAMM|nr:patatin-like phospholipase family protein [Microbulbifer donghaiensis]SHE71094.1 NTE family protein [Microbulbifer donghaiensis]